MFFKLLVNKLSPGSNVNIEKSKCINRRNKFEQCRKCMDSCPKGAVSIENGNVNIKKSLCAGCGICSEACPTGALELDMKEKEMRYQYIREENKNRVTIGCKHSGAGVDIRFECLCGVKDDYMVALILYLEKECVSIDWPECGMCTSGDFKDEHLHEKMSGIVNFFEELESGLDAAFGKMEESQVVRKYSRRDFFRLLKKKSFKAAERTSSNVIDHLEGRKFKFDAADEILKAAAMLSLEKVNIKTRIFTSFNVDETCSYCGMCTAICPVDAWKKHEYEGGSALMHSAIACKNCGMCVGSCPNKAIAKANCITTAALKNKYEIKRKFETGICINCGGEFTRAKSDNVICEICMRKAKRKEH